MWDSLIKQRDPDQKRTKRFRIHVQDVRTKKYFNTSFCGEVLKKDPNPKILDTDTYQCNQKTPNPGIKGHLQANPGPF